MKPWPALLLALLTAGCAGQNRGSLGPELAAAAGWQWSILSAGDFDLATASKPAAAGAILTVYIEGDGLAYVNPRERSMDPTPTDPVALRLALAHPGAGPVAYLARPCQYVLPSRPRNCRSDYWTLARYAPDVVESLSAALDQLKARSGPAKRLILVGYSGGGALAALLAERRGDVAGLVTVAADLDLDQWVRSLGLTPLRDSLDPATDAALLTTTPQVHFIGGKDDVVDSGVLAAFLSHEPPSAPAKTVSVPGETHTCCWDRAWPALARRPELAAIPGWNGN